MRDPRAPIGLAFMLVACSSSTPSPSDSQRRDLPGGDLGQRFDTLAGDRGQDRPKAPAVWKTISGGPQVYRPTATLLDNGDVLIAGGRDLQEAEQAGAYRYLAAQGQFVPAGTMATERFFHTASRLPDGRVLIAGGHNKKEYLQSTEIYDPSKPAGSAWSAGPEMFHQCSEHAAVTLADGRVLLSGGWTNGIESNGSLQIYDPASGAWQLVIVVLKEHRRRHTATLLKNGKVLLAGGIQGTSSNSMFWTYLDSIEVFDPTIAKISMVASKMSYQRLGHTASLRLDGRVLIAGGTCNNKCKVVVSPLDDLYDPATDTIFPIAHPGDYPVYHAAALLDDGRLIVIGGTISDPSKVFAFAPGTLAGWSALPGLAFGRTLATATRLLDGTVLVVGGLRPGASEIATTAERLFP